MRLTQLLNEEKTRKMEEIHNKIKKFFRKNPNPSDKQIHDYAESIGMNEHDFEEHIYMMLSNYVKKDNISERKQLTELFIEKATNDLEILRLSMIAELDAVNLYERLAGIARDVNVKKVLLDVAREEKVHAGEFEMLLEKIDPEYEKAEEEGEEEVEELLGK